MNKLYRLTVIADYNKAPHIVKVKIWEDVDHLTKSMMQECYNILYNAAWFDDNISCAALHLVDEDLLRYTLIAEMQAVRTVTCWPDQIETTCIYLNNKYIRTMGGKKE